MERIINFEGRIGRLKGRMIAVLIGVLLCMCFAVSPLLVGAESIAEAPETSTENNVGTDEIVDDEYDFETVGNVYYFVDPTNNTDGVRFTILENGKLQIDMYLSGELVATVNGQYDLVGNRLAVYAMNNWLGVFSLFPDGTAVEIVEEESQDTPIVDVSTEETSVSEEVEDDSEEIVAPIVSGLAGLAGATLLYLAFSGKMGKLKEAFDAILSWFKKKGEELVDEEVDLKNIKEGFLKAVQSNEHIQELLLQAQKKGTAEYQEMMTAVKSLAENMAASVQNMKDYYEAKAASIEAEYKQIKRILIKIASDDSMLVRCGIADEIVKELEKGIEVETE